MKELGKKIANWIAETILALACIVFIGLIFFKNDDE